MTKQTLVKCIGASRLPRSRNVRRSDIKKEYDRMYDHFTQSGQTEYLAHVSAFSKLARKYGSNRVELALLF
jgi:hypothetical protein